MFSGRRRQLPKNNEMDTSLLEWLYSDKCIKGLTAPNWSSILILTWVFYTACVGCGHERERELEWLGHMMLCQSIGLESTLICILKVHWFGWNFRIQWFWNILNINFNCNCRKKKLYITLHKELLYPWNVIDLMFIRVRKWILYQCKGAIKRCSFKRILKSLLTIFQDSSTLTTTRPSILFQVNASISSKAIGWESNLLSPWSMTLSTKRTSLFRVTFSFEDCSLLNFEPTYSGWCSQQYPRMC